MSAAKPEANMADGAPSATTHEHAQPRRTSTSASSSSAAAAAAAASSVPALRKQLSAGRLPPLSVVSAGTSPRSSRNTSPLRKESKPDTQANTLAAATTRLSSTGLPPAASIQRALSTSDVPQLSSGALPKDAVLRLPRAAQLGAEEAPHWPVSPRLKSPPPNGKKRTPATANSVKKLDDASNNSSAATTPTTQHVSTPSSTTAQPLQSPRQPTTDSSAKSEQQQSLQTPAKNASRGPSGKSVLATVDENSSDAAEPSPAVLQATADLKPLTKLSNDDPDKNNTDNDKQVKAGESGSESGGNKSEGHGSRGASMSQPAQQRRAKNSYSSLAGGKVRQPEGSGGMTVETETVQSIPHSGIGGTGERSSNNRSDGNTLRVKSSTETIRPKKERRPASRKPRSVTGNASTKADIFEARVASAVGEANSSDSEETFVYESNPPEPRRSRHHSRTPSVTSAHSTADHQRNGIRNIGDVVDERRIAGKRSMKFSKNPLNTADSPPDRPDGTVRSHQPRHYGRWGRGGSHASMFEPDSPFTAASKLRSNPHSVRHSRPNSPRSAHNASLRGIAPPVFGKKRDSPFDFDAEGDDERTPLMHGDHTPRSLRHAHRLGRDSDSASIDEYYGVRRRSRFSTLGGCLLGLLIFVLVVMSTIGFLIMSNRPLSDVHVRRIENVLASEEEIMLDMSVAALNPNALSVSISALDVNIFAKSKHLSKPHSPDKKADSIAVRDRNRRRLRVAGSDLDDLLPGPKKGKGGSDDDDEDGETALWLLGQALKFDQPLVFEGSPFRSKLLYSIGELRLAHPGNKTETGTARWEHILRHPFELIVRGVLKYKLPVSAREEAVTITSSILVHPEDGLDHVGRMRLEPVDHSDDWQWIDWERERDMLADVELEEFA